MVKKRDIKTPPLSAADLHLRLVLEDTEFLEKVGKIKSNSESERIENLAKDYAIKSSWVYKLVEYGPRLAFPEKEIFNYRAKIESDERGILIRIAPETTLDDVINEWPNVEYAKVFQYVDFNEKTKKYTLYSKPRNKKPEDPELVYAVFRARTKNDSFPKIFRQYQDGTLAHYLDKPTNNFSSSKSLEDYYNRHKPSG